MLLYRSKSAKNTCLGQIKLDKQACQNKIGAFGQLFLAGKGLIIRYDFCLKNRLVLARLVEEP